MDVINPKPVSLIIQERLDATTESDLIMPEYDPELDVEASVIGIAGHYMRKLYTLARQLEIEIEPLEAQSAHIKRRISERLEQNLSPSELVTVVQEPSFLEMAQRFDEIRTQIAPLNRLKAVVEEMFRYEMYMPFPFLHGKQVRIMLDDDWRITWQKNTQESPDPRMVQMMVPPFAGMHPFALPHNSGDFSDSSL